jgi:hypothetical protein
MRRKAPDFSVKRTGVPQRGIPTPFFPPQARSAIGVAIWARLGLWSFIGRHPG